MRRGSSIPWAAPRTRVAEGRADLSAQETQLAHASRVDAMGEMASVMAHQLAQPLTAVLSLTQAGRHLARRGDMVWLGSVLDDTVAQSRRAADILDRLRRWSKPNRAATQTRAMNDAARNVERLLAAEARDAGAAVNLMLSGVPICVNGDPVSLEQMVFNLLRNALEAAEAAQVTIRTQSLGVAAILEVSDKGPSVPEAIQARVFEPFVTGNPDGTALDLALCQRLIEEMGGVIIRVPDAAVTTSRLTLPLVSEQGSA